MFILYFDDREYAKHSEAFVGVKKNKSWTYSTINQFYNEEWLSSQFDKIQESGLEKARSKKNVKRRKGPEVLSNNFGLPR